MPDNSKKVINFYVDANANKYQIVKRDSVRDYSVAELTILSCLDAMFRHDYYANEQNEWDVNKVIRTIMADSLRGKMNNLSKKDEYEKLLDNTNRENENSLRMASTSYFSTFMGSNSDNQDFNDLLNNFSKLRHTIRIGHILWDAHGDRLESVLEHIYGTMILIMGIESEYGFKIDYNKILQMLLVHETEEIKKGDEADLHIPHDKNLGKRIVKEIFKNEPNGEYYIGLVDEFDKHDSINSEYAHLCDKLEYLLQVKMYELQGRYDFEHRPVNKATQSPEVLSIIENGENTVFGVHYEFDKHRFQNFPCLRRILEQAKNL